MIPAELWLIESRTESPPKLIPNLISVMADSAATAQLMPLVALASKSVATICSLSKNHDANLDSRCLTCCENSGMTVPQEAHMLSQQRGSRKWMPSCSFQSKAARQNKLNDAPIAECHDMCWQRPEISNMIHPSVVMTTLFKSL